MHNITNLTTFKLPAQAAAVCHWSSVDELRTILTDETLPRPFKMIGGGSNLLFTKPFEGTILVRSTHPKVRISGNRVTADANIILDDLCAAACAASLRGIENLSGIPGTLGGALVQNAGAYGAEIGTSLVYATLFDTLRKRILTVSPAWMDFAYRTSRLKAENGRYIILDAQLMLRPDSAPANLSYGNLHTLFPEGNPSPMQVRQAVLETRRTKLPDPAEVGSAGSFFRNPEVTPQLADSIGAPHFPLASGLVKVPAAWLIDHAGLKGAHIGGASIWQTQSLVIVNTSGNAAANDVLELENLIVNTVEQKFSITLQPEVEHI